MPSSADSTIAAIARSASSARRRAATSAVSSAVRSCTRRSRCSCSSARSSAAPAWLPNASSVRSSSSESSSSSGPESCRMPRTCWPARSSTPRSASGAAREIDRRARDAPVGDLHPRPAHARQLHRAGERLDDHLALARRAVEALGEAVEQVERVVGTRQLAVEVDGLLEGREEEVDHLLALGGDLVAAGQHRHAAALAHVGQRALHARQQRRALVRLADEVVGPAGEALDHVLRARERGQQDHRRAAQRRVGLERAAQRVAVHPRHHDVGQDQPGWLLAGELERRDAVARQPHVVAGLPTAGAAAARPGSGCPRRPGCRSSRPAPARAPTAASAIRSGASTSTAALSRTASPGMPKITLDASSWAIVSAPASRIRRSPSAPSRPMPVSRMPTDSRPQHVATESNRRLIEGRKPFTGGPPSKLDAVAVDAHVAIRSRRHRSCRAAARRRVRRAPPPSACASRAIRRSRR